MSSTCEKQRCTVRARRGLYCELVGGVEVVLRRLGNEAYTVSSQNVHDEAYAVSSSVALKLSCGV